MGCEACEQNLKAEIGDKDEEEMSEEEKKVLSGEKEMPEAYGPLSSWDGAYCNFCHGMGQFGAFSIGIFILAMGMFMDLPFPYVFAFSLFTMIGTSIVVGYYGRFPVLGALIGPIVERIFALHFGIFLTEASKKKYGKKLKHAEGYSHFSELDKRTMEGPELHIIASDWAVDACADIDADGAVFAVEVKNGQIIDHITFHPNMSFNRFQNVQDHVGVTNREVNNICQYRSKPTTFSEFAEGI